MLQFVPCHYSSVSQNINLRFLSEISKNVGFSVFLFQQLQRYILIG